MEEITGNIWPIMRRNIGTFFHWKINQKEKILKYHRQQKVSTERNRTDEINNRITNRHGNELTKRWNRDRDQKKKRRERKINTMEEQRRKERGRGMRGYASGVSSVDDMVHMPVNYPLSLVGETSHPCNVSLDPWGSVTVYGRGTMPRMLGCFAKKKKKRKKKRHFHSSTRRAK